MQDIGLEKDYMLLAGRYSNGCLATEVVAMPGWVMSDINLTVYAHELSSCQLSDVPSAVSDHTGQQHA